MATVEEFVLESGEGLIEVRGDGFDCGFLVNGSPIAFCWSDCQGSVGQYLLRSRDTADLSARLRELRHVAENGIQQGRPLAEQVWWLLRLFGNGSYRLRYEPALGNFFALPYESGSSRRQAENFYTEPADDVLVTTQPSDGLRPERVEFFGKRIATGARPVLFAAAVDGGWCSFVLDGHHKLQAYEELRLPPAVLFIQRLQPGHLSLSQGLQLLGEARQYNPDYERVKREYGGAHSEEDWHLGTNPATLLYSVRERVSDRKVRLFVVACARLVRHRKDSVLGVAERYADGAATELELAEAHRQMGGAAAIRTGQPMAILAGATAVPATYVPVPAAHKERQLALLHHIVGNPFRPYPVPVWPAAVVALAQAMYDGDSVSFALHDVLLETGHPDLAEHFRDAAAFHPKGCWAVDLILKKG